MLRRLFGSWFGSGRERRPRLNEEEALAIVREAASGYPDCENLSMVTCEDRSGILTWIVSSPSKGTSLQVSVIDATGHAIEIKVLMGR